MRFFTRSPDLEAQAPNRVRNRSRTRSQSVAQPATKQQSRSHSHTRSMSTTPVTAVSPARSAPLSKASTTKTLETPLSTTRVFSRPVIPYDNLVPATGGFTTAPTTPLASSRHPTSEVKEMDEKFEQEKRAFLEKYDPGDPGIPVTPLSDVKMHRRMILMLYVDNLLWANARLQRHIWIAASEKSAYKELHTTDRHDGLHEDLMRYTQAVKSLEYWRTSMIQTERVITPPNYDAYGRTLAMLECAAHHETDPASTAMIQKISASLFHEFAEFSRIHENAHVDMAQTTKAKHRKRQLLNRMAMSTFGGLTLIVPMLIMVMDPRIITTVVTTSVFTLAIGLILAVWMDEAESKDMIGATAAYAAVLVVFVGSGSNF